MLSEFKKVVLPILVLTVVFTAALLIKSQFVDPVADEAYAEIYGLDQEGAEW